MCALCAGVARRGAGVPAVWKLAVGEPSRDGEPRGVDADLGVRSARAAGSVHRPIRSGSPTPTWTPRQSGPRTPSLSVTRSPGEPFASAEPFRLATRYRQPHSPPGGDSRQDFGGRSFNLRRPGGVPDRTEPRATTRSLARRALTAQHRPPRRHRSRPPRAHRRGRRRLPHRRTGFRAPPRLPRVRPEPDHQARPGSYRRQGRGSPSPRLPDDPASVLLATDAKFRPSIPARPVPAGDRRSTPTRPLGPRWHWRRRDDDRPHHLPILANPPPPISPSWSRETSGGRSSRRSAPVRDPPSCPAPSALLATPSSSSRGWSGRFARGIRRLRTEVLEVRRRDPGTRQGRRPTSPLVEKTGASSRRASHHQRTRRPREMGAGPPRPRVDQQSDAPRRQRAFAAPFPDRSTSRPTASSAADGGTRWSVRSRTSRKKRGGVHLITTYSGRWITDEASRS